MKIQGLTFHELIGIIDDTLSCLVSASISSPLLVSGVTVFIVTSAMCHSEVLRAAFHWYQKSKEHDFYLVFDSDVHVTLFPLFCGVAFSSLLGFHLQVTWLEGHSLAQTMFTNLYLHNPYIIEDRVLKAFSINMLKTIDLIRDRVNRAGVFEEVSKDKSEVPSCSKQWAKDHFQDVRERSTKKASG